MPQDSSVVVQEDAMWTKYSGTLDFHALASIIVTVILVQTYVVISFVGSYLEKDRQEYILRLSVSVLILVFIAQPALITGVAFIQMLVKRQTDLESLESDHLSRQQKTEFRTALTLTKEGFVTTVRNLTTKSQFPGH